MNQIIPQTLQANDYSKFAAALAVVLIVVVVLMTLVIHNQHKEIRDLKTPRYGFLGKSLLSLVLIAFTFGSFGFFFVTLNNNSSVQTTNANSEVKLLINVIKIDNLKNIYSINIIPELEGVAWGNNSNNIFNVYWNVSSNSNNATITELGLNLNNQGGLKRILGRGVTTIKATVFFNNKSYENSVTITN